MSDGEGPQDVPNTGAPPYSVHNQNPLRPISREESVGTFAEDQPTSSTAGHDTRASHKLSNLTRASSPPSADEAAQSTGESSSSESCPSLLSDEDFEKALLGYGRRRCFMLGLFLLCTSPGILNGFHVIVYVFYGHTPKHWCSVSILEDANWTPEQIRNISSPRPGEWSNCEYYDEDYERLRRMGYERAFQKVRKEARPGTLRCGHFSYEIEELGTSLVTEWDLVCSRLALKATVQTAVSLGKLLGAFGFGILADKCGRKLSFTIASFIYMAAGPLVALTSLYQVMLAARFCLGIAGLGVYESAYSLVTEICPPEIRPTVGIMYNHSYPLGMLGIAAIGYYVRDWRKLQFYISLPALLLIIHVCVIPESPRWLYYSGQKKRAWMVVGKFLPPDNDPRPVVERLNDTENRTSRNRLCVSHGCTPMKNNLMFLKNYEFRRRLFICWIIWCFTAMSYYALSINTEYFRLDPYLYVALSGIAECISYILALPLLRIFGRRAASTALLLCGASSLLLLLLMPVNMRISKLIAALLGRLCVSGVFCVVIIHVCELFPTTIRNSAIGSSSTWAHIGSMFAPYLVDFFVIYGRWVPSTICGITLFTAALLAQTLPETRGLALYNTLQDFVTRCQANPRERVSFGNCTIFYICEKCKGFYNQSERSTTI